MYNPAAFRVTELPSLHEFMRRHSFATLVSSLGDGVAVSHVPLLLDVDRGPQGTLIGHFARANDHWHCGEACRTTAIFQGPHAYISPTWYAESNVVPTWNYVTVHATGPLRLVHDRDRLLEIVLRTTTTYEASQSEPWRMESQDPEFIERLLGGIVGFELPIEQLDGKWKLGQNHSAVRRERVIQQLRHVADAEAAAVADLMAATLPLLTDC